MWLSAFSTTTFSADTTVIREVYVDSEGDAVVYLPRKGHQPDVWEGKARITLQAQHNLLLVKHTGQSLTASIKSQQLLSLNRKHAIIFCIIDIVDIALCIITCTL